MIIGRGMVATAFAPAWQDDRQVCILAAGVSNSREQDPAQFEREELLLQNVMATDVARVVYFGSCAVGNPNETESPYLLHKRRMESLVIADPRGRVLRLPQVVGQGGNPGTLTNFLSARISSGEYFEVWRNAERNLIDIDDVCALATHVIRNDERYPKVMSIAAPTSTPMLSLVQAMEDSLGRPGNYCLLDKGTPFMIDTVDCARAANEIGMGFSGDYYKRVIRKYYSTT
ncbi:NAD-dependent epimerase/dehydratase family protein [Stenotrophomonas maltophilia]|uniref:NAD-dependent epimerase/dehydratase family protein n=1 Tax=Stenotrophomonas maltophilia TaxID=40324 RepID=UPI0039F69357